MAIIHKALVGEVASNKPNAATAFNLPDTPATGFLQSFDTAYASGDLVPYTAKSSTAYEEGIGTFTAGVPDTLTRSLLHSSSTGSLIDWSAGGDVTVFTEFGSTLGQQTDFAIGSLLPGGRLTLESGQPLSITDQLAKTSLIYTSYVHDRIGLWDGFRWRPVQFAETSLAVGTLASTLPHDVYAFLSSGVLALELLVWTSTTARATEATYQDGRLCKSGDKTRLLLGTILPKTTTTLEFSTAFIGVSNVYNQLFKTGIRSAGASSHTFTTDSTIREYNATTNVNIIKFVNATNIGSIPNTVFATISGTVVAGSAVGCSLDSSTVHSTGVSQVFNISTTGVNISASSNFLGVTPGDHTIFMTDRNISTGDLTANNGQITANILC